MNKNKLLTVLCCLFLFETLLIPVTKAQESSNPFSSTKENLNHGKYANIRAKKKSGKRCPTFASFQSRLNNSYNVLLGPLTDGTVQGFQLNITMIATANTAVVVGYASFDLLNGVTFTDGAGNIYFDSFNFTLPVVQGGKLTVYDCFVFLDAAPPLSGTCSGIATDILGILHLTPTLITLEPTS